MRFIEPDPINWAELRLEDRERLEPYLRQLLQHTERFIKAYNALPEEHKSVLWQLAQRAPSERAN